MIASKKILIVEDEPALTKVLLSRCEKQGYQVVEAANGKIGLQIAAKEHPDLILLDILMPEMDGMDMLAKLRQSSWGEHIPVILLTNLDADDRIIRGAVENNPSYYLIKSHTTIEDIIQKVESIIHPTRLKSTATINHS